MAIKYEDLNPISPGQGVKSTQAIFEHNCSKNLEQSPQLSISMIIIVDKQTIFLDLFDAILSPTLSPASNFQESMEELTNTNCILQL